jgi:hypothetical protein
MKFLEEIESGSLFIWNNSRFILTSDYKEYKDKKSTKMSVNIDTGNIQWIISDAMVEELDLYYRDKDSNIIALKERKNEYSEKNTNIS